jgi:hypothetical protein
MQFFKVNNILVDVEKGFIIDTLNGKQMQINLSNFSMMDFKSRIKAHAIRIDLDNGKPIPLWWSDKLSCWKSFKDSHGKDIDDAIQKYINVMFEKELLG